MPEDPTRASSVRYQVLAALCLAAAIAYLSRNAFGVAEDSYRGELGIDVERSAVILSSFYIAYAFLQVPAAWLVERWGGRAALTLFAVAWSAAAIATALAQSTPALFASRFACGAAQAGVFTASVSAFSRWFPAAERGRACGLLGASMYLGGAAASAITGLLLPAIGWRWSFALFALPGVLWALWFRRWYRDHPEAHPAVNAAELESIGVALAGVDAGRVGAGVRRPAPRAPWLRLLAGPGLWLIAIQQFARAAGAVFYATWCPTYLKVKHQVSTEDAGLLTSLPLVALMLGSWLGGDVADFIWRRSGRRWLSRQGIAIASLLACAALTVLAYGAEGVGAAIALLSAGSFLAALSGPCAYAITIDLGGAHVASVFSAMNMAGNVGALVCPVAVERLVAWSGRWDHVLVLFAAVYLVAALAWALLRHRPLLEEDRSP
jgi:sugar phosphate permease